MFESSTDRPPAPAWLEWIVDGVKAHERAWLLAGTAFQALVLVGTLLAGLR